MGDESHLKECLDEEACDAVVCGRQEVSKEAVNRGLDPDYTFPDSTGTTLLHTAAQQGHTHVMKYIIGNQGLVNARDYLDRTPLHVAKNKEATRILAKNGADVNAADFNLWRPLHYAVIQNNAELIKFLLIKGADASAIDLDGNTPCHVAADYGRLNLLKILLPAMKQNLCNGLKQTVYDLILQRHADWRDANKFSKFVRKFELLRQRPVLLNSLPEAKDFLLDLDRDQYFLGQVNVEKSFGSLTKPTEALEILTELASANLEEKEEHLKTLLKRYVHPPIHWLLDGHSGCEVAVRVQNFVNFFVKEVAKIDPRFAGTIEPIGSSGDGSKLGSPDEFDFLLAIQDLVNAQLKFHDSRPGHVQIRLTDCDTQKRWKSLTNAENELHERHVNSHFGCLLWKTSRRLKSLTKFSFHFRKVVRLHDFHLGYPKHAAPLLCCQITGLWIDVDVIPGIKIQGWPKQQAIPYEQLKKVLPASVKDEQIGFCVVPKTVGNQWELSFVTTEKVILNHTGESFLNAFRVLKILNTLLHEAAGAYEDGKYSRLMDKWPSSYIMKIGSLRYLASTATNSGGSHTLTEKVVKILQIVREEVATHLEDHMFVIQSFFVPGLFSSGGFATECFLELLDGLVSCLTSVQCDFPMEDFVDESYEDL